MIRSEVVVMPKTYPGATVAHRANVTDDRAVAQVISRWLLLVVVTGAGTAAFAALDLPSPALFAGLLAGATLALLGRAPRAVPRPAVTLAQAVIGVVIGLLAQPSSLAALARDWLPVLLVGLGTLAASMLAGLLLGLRPGVSPLTGMLALTAGGASGLVAISRDLGGDVRVVAVVQYLRVGLVTAAMPIVAVGVFDAARTDVTGSAAAGASWYVDVAVVIVCCGLGVPLARLMRVPAPGLLGPMTVALVLALAGLTGGAVAPQVLVELAYAVIGWHAGVGFTRESLRTVIGVLPVAAALIAAVVGLCAGLGLLLSRLTGTTALEGYLATTPGGIFAVLAIAISAGVDVTFVVAVQVLRVIVMLLVAPAMARLVTGRGGHRP
jgi:membrane AbrB-like protein